MTWGELIPKFKQYSIEEARGQTLTNRVHPIPAHVLGYVRELCAAASGSSARKSCR